jgi:thymidylate kinase
MVSAPQLICVTGPDGSGKTTQIARIAEALAKRGKKKIVPMTIWDMLLDPTTRGRVAFKSPGELDAFLEVLSPMARMLFLAHCLYAALDLAVARKPDLVLVNGYWYKYWATEVAHGGDPEAMLGLMKIFPEPALTFCLDISTEEAFRRKTKPSGYETGFAAERTLEAFSSFQARARPPLERLANEKQWVRLNGNESVHALSEAIVNRIDARERC